ncbi:MAG TPA: SRPBCC family protein [Chloroflexota bacterium]|nr:SRPBCC family protein [Chloroflexota bacterium]
MIEVDEQFEVPAPAAVVWQLLADPYAVVGCVPGAAIVGEQADGSLETTLSIKFGPVLVAFQARAVLDLDVAARRGRLSARGKDQQGGARFEATASFSVAEHPTGPGSVVATHGQVDISGRMAALIEGGASVVVKRMSAEFASCLSARCSGHPNAG